ncbi:hypothetical protein HYZ76_02445 [Candidatus Falkowbacteria bacterium]|nr:hypothetical protein [Candidatus Falkowbacteria bacterium]
MFGLAKNKKAKENKIAEELTIDPQLSEQIHVMPGRFYVRPKKKMPFWIFVVIIGILFVGGLVLAAFYLNQALNDQQNKNFNAMPDQNININDPAETNTNQESVINQNSNVSAEVNININTDIATTTGINLNVNTNISQTEEPVSAAADQDSDGLTLVEENIYGTDPNNNDSDGDTYFDGSELINGFSPLAAGETLAETNLFTSYNHPVYTIIYPDSWELREQGSEEALFISASGEFVEVLIISNINGLAIDDWYLDQFPGAAPDELAEVSINNLEGIRHSDLRSYYLVKPGDTSRIYLLTYNVGNRSSANFLTTFNIMVKSFNLLP